VVAARERVEAMRALLEAQRLRENLLQERYKRLTDERDDLLAAAQGQQPMAVQ
jgi:hypothetical protein